QAAAAGAQPEPELPPVSRGQDCLCLKARHERKLTEPPRRYSEATLLGAMERAGRDLEEEELRAALRDLGLGTPATRAATIETLIRRRYLGREGKVLRPTPVGRALIGGLPVESLTSAALTGEWEARLARIARGEEDPAAFRRDLRTFVRDAVAALLEAPRIDLPDAPGGGGGG
ncbi:MAG TPA: DNA topoisomerase III, partial [Planctomycetes bacterium]|nr:DNA topoisomerase III [Planctomycetota bacterium]